MSGAIQGKCWIMLCKLVSRNARDGINLINPMGRMKAHYKPSVIHLKWRSLSDSSINWKQPPNLEFLSQSPELSGIHYAYAMSPIKSKLVETVKLVNSLGVIKWITDEKELIHSAMSTRPGAWEPPKQKSSKWELSCLILAIRKPS